METRRLALNTTIDAEDIENILTYVQGSLLFLLDN
jgi:hypothetical protein